MSRAMRRSARGAALSLVASGCLSTEIEQATLPVCAGPPSSTPEPSGVVRITFDGPTFELCNGVAIAPTLLLTALNCATELAAPEDGRAGFEPPRCQPSNGSAREDGSFLDQLARLAEPASISVQREDGEVLGSAVTAVFVANGESACMPGLAILQMQLPLDLPIATLRLDATEQVGQDVTVIGFDLSTNRLERHVSSATILEATLDAGSESLGPRSLLLSGESCSLPGGGVFASDGGALIGSTRASERSLFCPFGMGPPQAARVAPFRRFLLETAARAGTSLIAEASAAGEAIPPCSGGG